MTLRITKFAMDWFDDLALPFNNIMPQVLDNWRGWNLGSKFPPQVLLGAFKLLDKLTSRLCLYAEANSHSGLWEDMV